MRKQVILSLFLLTILMGQAVAIPLIIPLAVGAIGGGIVGYILGNEFNLHFLEPNVNPDGDAMVIYTTTKTALLTNARDYEFIITTYKNLAEYVKYYALARAKAVYAIEVAKGLNNTDDLSEVLTNAMNKATDVASDTLDNATENLLCFWDNYVNTLRWNLKNYIESANTLNKDPGLNPDDLYQDCISLDSIPYNGNLDVSYTVIYNDYQGKDVPAIYLEGKKLYDVNDIVSILDIMAENREFVINNLVTYFEEVNNKVLSGEINISELANEVIDPYALLTMAQNDSTNSLVWAQYSLALMGLQTNTTAPVTVKVGNETYEGYIFASYPTNFEVGHNYTVPDDQAVFILTSDGKLVTLQPGDSFELVRAVDEKTGKELDNINMTSFTPASFNASAYDEELGKLIELQKEILDKLTTTGGGSDWADKINDFWNGLDWQVKAFIVGGGILVAIILIGRSFGRGGVSVIRVEEPRK